MGKINIRFGATPGASDAALQELSVAREKPDGTTFPNLRGRLDELDTSLAQKAKQTDLDTTNTNLTKNTNFSLSRYIEKPTGFTPTIPLDLFLNNSGQVDVLNFNIESLHPIDDKTGKTYYVSKDGNNANDGLTMATAFRTIDKAWTKIDIDILIIKGGKYNNGDGASVALPSRNIKVKSYNNEKVYLRFVGSSSVGGNLTWTNQGGGVYSATRASAIGVFDSKVLDKYNNATKYTKKTTLTDVQATAGTWYTDGTLVYVHTLDGNAPIDDNDISVALAGGDLLKFANKYYFENIVFEMNTSAISAKGVDTILFKNCTFRNSCTKNGLSALNTTLVVCQDCNAYGNACDGFNYSTDSGATGRLNFIEINCKGYSNGFNSDNTSADNNNGSTSHDNCTGIRVNGMYFDNKGPNVVDVQSSPNINKTLCVNCTAYNSQAVAPYPNDFQTTGTMWLDTCTAYGSQVSLCQAVAGVLYTKNTRYLGNNVGVITPY